MNYVMHFCRNSRLSERNKNYCNNGWIDKDLTNAQVNAPDWKYCRERCEKLCIDYDEQTPDSNLTEKELIHKNRLRERIKKANQIRLQNIKSTSTKQG